MEIISEEGQTWDSMEQESMVSFNYAYQETDSEPLLRTIDLSKDVVVMGMSKTYVKEDSKKARTILGVKVKKETTVWNLMALFVAPLIATTAGSFMNAIMPYLLQDDQYFGVAFENVGSVAGQALFWSYLVSTLVTPGLGYVYDIIGRFWFMIPCCFILAFQLAIIPYSAPHFWLLCVMRSIMSCIVNVICVNPLVIDYVKSESRGLIMSLATLGLVLGELTMVGLFTATRSLTLANQLLIPAIVVAVISFFLIFLVREPKIKDPFSNSSRQAPETINTHSTQEPSLEDASNNIDDLSEQNHSLFEKFQSLSYEAWNECRTRPKYIFCFICLPASRLITVLFSVYLQLWVMSFETSGVLKTKEQSDEIFMKVVTGSLASILFVAPLFGVVSDKVDARVIVPITFLLRSIISGSFLYIDDPRSNSAYIITVLLMVVSLVQFISVEVLFMRNMKPHIRGTLSGLAHFFGSLGTTVFVLLGGILFDKVGPWAPFTLLSMADGTVLCLTLIFICFGIIDKHD